MARQGGGHYATRDADAGQDNDSENDSRPDGDSPREMKENTLNVHRDSVNLIGCMRNVTLVSTVVRGYTMNDLASSAPFEEDRYGIARKWTNPP
jgi:hypothetical protein